MGEHPDPDEEAQDQQDTKRSIYRLVVASRVLFGVAVVGFVAFFTECLFGLLAFGELCLAAPLALVGAVGTVATLGTSMVRLRRRSAASPPNDHPLSPPDEPE